MNQPVKMHSGPFAAVVIFAAAVFWLIVPRQGFSASVEIEKDPKVKPQAVVTPDFPIYLPFVAQANPIRTIFGYENGSISVGNGVNEMRRAGANWVRRAGIWWPDVEPTKGTYDWGQLSVFEAEFQLARSMNMEVVILVRGTPNWAQAAAPYNRTCGRIKQSELDSFAAFVGELVTRYSIEPYSVKYWEFYNEPDVDPTLVAVGNEWMGCWGEAGDPYYGGEYYAEMLQAVYPAVKGANADAKVLIGGLLLDCDPEDELIEKDCTPSNFIKGILENDGGPYFDGISFHAYDYTLDSLGGYHNPLWSSDGSTNGPSLFAKANYLQNVLTTYSVTGKFLMNTEAALLCVIADLSVCETTKAYYVVHSYVAALKENLTANLWYFWYYRKSELFEQDLTLLPAYTSYSFARQELWDASYSQEITDHNGVRIYEFTTNSGTLWVMWSLDGNVHNGLVLPSTPDVVYDAFGSSITPGATIDVDLKPLYLEWDS